MRSSASASNLNLLAAQTQLVPEYNDEVEYYENDDKEDVMNNFLEYSVNKQKTS